MATFNDVEGTSNGGGKKEVHRAMRRVSQAFIPAFHAFGEDDTPRDEEGKDMKAVSASVAVRMEQTMETGGKRIRDKADTAGGRDLGNDNDEEAVRERPKAFATLSSQPPFSYLPEGERRALVLDLQLCTYSEGDVIIYEGRSDQDVYVTTEGRVMLVKMIKSGGKPKFLGYLDAPEVFGEFGPLFETNRASQVVAGGDVRAYRMSGERFLRLLSYLAFKLKMALGMRNKGLFSDISSFVAVVNRSVAALEKEMDFQVMLEAYRRMVPAIHARLHSPELDIDGWTYAIRRLPDTVTSTYVYLLSNSVPMPFMNENFDLAEISVPSAARRRLAFAVDQSKLLVIVREKFSDVLDFISLLCAHVHESQKLRLKLRSKPAAFDTIHECLWSAEKRVADGDDNSNKALLSSAPSGRPHLRYNRNVRYMPVPVNEQAAALAKLPLNDDEIRGLQTLWPKDFLYRIWDMVAMHENIQVKGDFSASYVESSDRWVESIRRATIDLFKQRINNGDKEICVYTDLTTHIVSSNTTSVRNLLSPYILKHAADIHKWGIEAHPEIEKEDDLSEADKLCALCTAYMMAHPHARDEQDDFDAPCIKTMRHTELTGIQVELYDLDALCDVYAEHNIEADPYLAPFIQKNKDDSAGSHRRRLLVNIDYAFGKQAEQLISALCLLFGESVASVGVMGKAGGLQGKRGDIAIADYLIFQDGDEMTLIDNTGVDREALARMSGRKVWSGGILTVLGTLLQDKRLLQYYRKLMGCVSLEMEGSFYAREVMRFKKAKLMKEDMHMRFIYYFSDTPLSTDQTETLSKDFTLSELIPPQYAVTRELLRLVLTDDVDK